MLTWSSYAATDIGTVRAGNEDAFIDLPARRLWGVADGAGGHDHGEVASGALKAALELPVTATDRVLVVRTLVAGVHDALLRRAAAEVTDHAVTIASTLVVLLADGPHFACLWCGDSRAYLLRAGTLTQLTRDHSLVQELVDAGTLATADMERHPSANVLTRAIGAPGPAPEIDKITGQAEAGDCFLLCSDGLFKALDAGAILPILAQENPAAALIAAAIAAGARDNVTAVVVHARAAPADGTVLRRAR